MTTSAPLEFASEGGQAAELLKSVSAQWLDYSRRVLQQLCGPLATFGHVAAVDPEVECQSHEKQPDFSMFGIAFAPVHGE